MADIHHSKRHRDATIELKARGARQRCITCPKILLASAPKGHPLAITLGHHFDLDSGAVSDPYHPSAYGPQCGPCNYSAAARRTNAKRRGERPDELRSSPDWA
ncbi:hypothetical protein [uncultured Microbacterium sp.]|uniref:hypothetical protein n=1 Tax=uncultured Microbacterium sp. TaxID=191216 RepID=UPI0025F02061|nr:hypothetical protein [uncultured Microbacterium sp.]